ncbi:hypothetical protein DUI87_08006 [Hirundo rustica rustica]|uniref:Uncharacterized protein n=1 Tax=Hirundo rustica rustica TaxID=333673 RepID=A0A3M0KR86_HIRRU|nr:hypothetical protein DUI87_08006 [Hirundo rustica rustica]
MTAEKSEPDKGSTEKITSALPFFTSDAFMVITSHQNVAKRSSVHPGFEKDMDLKHRALLSNIWTAQQHFGLPCLWMEEGGEGASYLDALDGR